MATGIFDDRLIKHMWGTDELRAIFSDSNKVQKWFDIEAALAIEQAALGIIPKSAADEIAAKAKVANVDMEEIGAGMKSVRHPLVPALKALQKACKKEAGEFIHFGPTTQDITDTALMLQVKEAHAIFLRDVKLIGKELYRLSKEHMSTPMVGRSLGTQALPITFGHKTAIWLSEVTRHYERLRQLEERVFVGLMVGGVGTKASFAQEPFEVDARVMKRLGLAVADISWQPARDRFAEYVNLLGLIGGTIAKIANEIYILTHNEIDEISEPAEQANVGSSTMPHKRNPFVVMEICAVGRSLRYNASLMMESMVTLHERDGSGWFSEWRAVPESCLMLGVMLSRMHYVLAGLVVNTSSMRRNLNTMGGYLLTERIMFALSDKVGKQTAHDVMHEVAIHGIEKGLSLEESLSKNKQIGSALSPGELKELLDPTTYIGFAPEIVERVLKDVDKSGWLKV
ncbi:MAG: adenylosuccinate lyase [Burkholderiales bacterium]|nr:adenylosuccinate lyase [Burkholderiales bacterium]